jgi:integrase
MSELLRKNASDYLLLRRLRGYQQCDQAWLIREYLDFLDQHGFSAITVTNALAWACLPVNTRSRWRNQRLTVIRLFAAHIHANIPEIAELIPPGLLPARVVRAAPYLYGSGQVDALIGEAGTLKPALQGQTLATIIGLMASTGMRTAEALALNTADVDTEQGTILVRGKGGKQRLLPVHDSTLTALARYGKSRRVLMTPHDDALFVIPSGSRPLANTVQQAFRRVATACNLRPAPGKRNPRLHDLRHTFAVNTLIDAHRSGYGIDARIAALATYLGHSSPIHTYWYLSASPELLQLVSDRIEKHVQGDRT